MLSALRRGALGAALAVFGLVAASGCDVADRLFGGDGGGDSDTLRLQSIEISSDRPVDPAAPTGPASVAVGTTIRFTATGTYLNLDEETTSTRDVTGSVVWTSSDPAYALPASDGRLQVTTNGSASISASSPAVGDIPALESNVITLTTDTST